jgi:hypothetical protein
LREKQVVVVSRVNVRDAFLVANDLDGLFQARNLEVSIDGRERLACQLVKRRGVRRRVRDRKSVRSGQAGDGRQTDDACMSAGQKHTFPL